MCLAQGSLVEMCLGGGDVGKALNTSGRCVVALKDWRGWGRDMSNTLNTPPCACFMCSTEGDGLEWCSAGLGIGMWVP